MPSIEKVNILVSDWLTQNVLISDWLFRNVRFWLVAQRPQAGVADSSQCSRCWRFTSSHVQTDTGILDYDWLTQSILISDWLISSNMLMFHNALSLEDSSSIQQNFLTGKYSLLIGWYKYLLISDWLTAWSELFQTWGHWIFLGQILAGFQRTESQVCISNPDWLILVHTWFWLVDAN